MRALVVYESMFGNTRTIADAVALGLSLWLDADVVEVGEAPTALPGDVGLLVVGGPTHAFGMSRPGTRREAAGQAENPVVSAGVGLREWLAGVRVGATDIAAATFDTRVRKPHLPGSAAAAAAKRLRRLGFRVVARPESFYVDGKFGPLLSGEPERARRWAEGLGSARTVTENGRRAS
jgi:hypothetical protein